MEMKDAYLQQIERQLGEWKIDINRLESKAGKVDPETRIVYLEKVDDLKAKQNAAQVNLKKLKGASEDNWDALKTGYEQLQQDIKESIENAQTSIG